MAKPLAEANVCSLKQLTWITSHANRMQIFSGLPSLQHACFFVPVFSLYTFTPSCPLLVGTVTLRYIYVCTLYLKLCNIIRLLLFIPNNYYKYLTTGWWKHLNGTLYHIIFFSGIPMVRLSNFPCLPWLMLLNPVSPVSYFSFHQIVFNRSQVSTVTKSV